MEHVAFAEDSHDLGIGPKGLRPMFAKIGEIWTTGRSGATGTFMTFYKVKFRDVCPAHTGAVASHCFYVSLLF